MTEYETTELSLDCWSKHLRQVAVSNFQRIGIVLSGSRSYCIESATVIINSAGCDSALWVSNQLPGALTPSRAKSQLGKEYDALVFDAFESFDVDAFGAVSGTLCGGGLLILLEEGKDVTSLRESRFYRRCLSLFTNQPDIYYLQQGIVLPSIDTAKTNRLVTEDSTKPFRTIDQQLAVAAIESLVLESRLAPIVLTSDRGRGKSSALGLAAGRLLMTGSREIIVTSPVISMVEPVFRHAAQILPDADMSAGELRWQQGRLKFMALDALLQEKPSLDLLLVDEAAAVPVPMLKLLLRLYPCSVFSTTIHGYEGTGRGFALKFNQVLDDQYPAWQRFNLHTPVRWGSDDPVEAWVDKLLCLDAELPAVPAIEAIETSQCKVQLLNRDELLSNPTRLSALFALLVFAHYRTRPSDLQHLLDAPDVRLYALEYQQQVLGVLLVNEEGGFDPGLSSEIYRGERRPQGHLLAQTLTFHAGCEYAATRKYARIMRIAVHPELQGNGLGSLLLRNVVAAESQRVDMIGSSFGATGELIRFWQSSGFEIVRMGFTRDHASGTHSAVMLKALSDRGGEVVDELCYRFRASISCWLADGLETVTDEVRGLLLLQQLEDSPQLNNFDWQDIKSFAYNHRGYEACIRALKKLIASHASIIVELDFKEQQVIRARIRHQQGWSEIASAEGLSGRAEAIAFLRKAVRGLLSLIGEDNK